MDSEPNLPAKTEPKSAQPSGDLAPAPSEGVFVGAGGGTAGGGPSGGAKANGPTDSVDDCRAAVEYRGREALFARRLADLESTDRLFVLIRSFLFLVIIAVGIAAVGDASISFLWILVPVAAFAAVVRAHQPTLKRLQRTRSAHEYYVRCLGRLKGDWRNSGHTGERFADAAHAWSSDLDLFGEGSLFQKMNQCRTLPGQRKLAAWLTTVPDKDTAVSRQLQSESLRDHVDLRERLASIDEDVDWEAAEKTLHGWISESPSPFPVLALWGARILGFASVVVVGLAFTSVLPVSSILLMLLLQVPFIMVTRTRIQEATQQVNSVDNALRQLAEVTAQFESFPFAEKSLQQLQGKLQSESVIASERIEQLSRLVQWLNNSTRNQFFIPIAWLLGLFVHLTYRIDRWRVRYGGRVGEWLEAAAILEAVSSVAAFNYENDTYCLPEVSSEPTFQATSLGHPLLPTTHCIRNDVALTSQCPLMLISGSNMSGKSTLLRSVGINTVMAFVGARVHAKALTVFPFQLGTAMRVSDSLQEGRSLFYSVVKRLKTIVDLTSEGTPVLFLLDEILSGTNSHDRRTGAEAVIRTLVKNQALGMVTTHDLTLTQIVDSMQGQAVNKHFEDHVEEGRMTFDYQLRDGVVERSNAIELMRMMGLDV